MAARRPRAVLLFLAAALAGSGAARAALDPTKTVGPEVCGRCHAAEYAVWQKTEHAKIYSFTDLPLHKRHPAQDVLTNLGGRLIKTDSLCLNCHYTPEISDGRVTARAGVSCESCHGAAQAWLTVHNSIEGHQTHRDSETPEQHRTREERNASLGMYTRARIYELASRCYQCHMVPDERLVNVGKHTTGGDFDLPSRFSEIRHDFVSGRHTQNPDLSPARKRQFYVLGVALELEYGLRGIAAATAEGSYARALSRRVTSAGKKLAQVQRLAHLPQLEAMQAAVQGLRLEPGNRDQLAAAASRVGAETRRFTLEQDGSRLAALDTLLQETAAEATDAAGGAAPGGDQAAAGAAASGAAGGAGAAGAAAAPGGAGGLAGPGAGAGGAAGRAAGGVRGGGPAGGAAHGGGAGAEGAVRAQIRLPLTQNRTIGQSKCEGCHGPASDWWNQDTHSHAADGFLNQKLKNKQIATLYYGQPAAQIMATGRSVCMGCHSTVISGREAKEVETGVGCESCHGPASQFLATHKSVAPAARLQLGMTDLKNLDRRAEVCSGCHYVTDQRLLSSGHPSGKDFDLVARDKKIEHWKGGQPAAALLRASYQRALGARGAVPQVRVAKLEGGEGGGGGGGEAAGGRAGGGAGGPAGGRGGPAGGRGGASGGRMARGGRASGSGGGGGFGARSEVSAPAEAGADGGRDAGGSGGGAAGAAAAALPPLPDDVEKRPVEELLLLIKARLDALYGRAGGRPAAQGGQPARPGGSR